MPEFEELAAMQAGFAYRPVVVRMDGSSDAPRSVMGEFVSGNYFRTFGLNAAAGRAAGRSRRCGRRAVHGSDEL